MPPEDTVRPSPDMMPDMTVADLMKAWPSLIPLFLRRRMGCPGCAMAPFMTVREAAQAHAPDPDAFLSDLAAALDGDLCDVGRGRLLGG